MVASFIKLKLAATYSAVGLELQIPSPSGLSDNPPINNLAVINKSGIKLAILSQV